MPEKKDKTAATRTTASKNGFWSSSMPAYLGILLLVLGIVAGFGFHAVFFPAKVIVQKPETKPLSVSFSMLVHPDCKLCPEQSSFELLLAQRGILSNVQKLDATSSAGKEMVQKFSIQSFPAVVINPDELSVVDPGLLTVLKSKFPSALQQGSLVLEERNLMAETKVYSAYMLAQAPTDANCSVPAGKVLLWEFGDNLDKASYDALPTVSKIWTDFNASLNYDFKHLVLQPDSEDAALLDFCAKEAGLFPAYHQKSMELYFSRGRHTWEYIEARNIADTVGLKDENAFKACYNAPETRAIVAANTGAEPKLAQSYEIQQIPSFVLDCRFVVIDSKNLEKDLCLQHPELKACETQ